MDADLREHYEDARLAESMKLLRTRVLLERHLPAKASVLDVGGGSGFHATWLTERGHRVRLIDPIARHVATARARGVDAVAGDARALTEPDASHDAVLALGPLYHLLAREDRVLALTEARRVTRGLVVAAVISRWAPLCKGMPRGATDSPGFTDMLREDLSTGVRRGTQDIPFGFTTCYFHRPEEIEREVADAGLTLVDLLPIEGMAHWIPDLSARLSDPANALLLELLARTEREPAILGATSHLLAIARR